MVNYVAQIAISVAIFVILAASLNLILGYGGIFSVVHAAFFGIGAYTSGQMVLLLGAPFPLDLIGAFASAALVALLVGPFIVRLKEEYIIVGTLALQLVLSNVFLNWQPVTGGSYGLFGITRPAIGGWVLTSVVEYAVFALLLTAACFAILWRMVQSPFGLALKGVREDPLLAESFGKPVNRQRAIAFVVGSGIAGVAGMVYARQVGYLDPSTFGISQSLSIITILVVGGLGNLWGTLVAATVLETVPQVLRFIPATGHAVPHLQLLFFGLLLVVLVRMRPQGLISERPLVRAGLTRTASASPSGPANDQVIRIDLKDRAVAGLVSPAMPAGAPSALVVEHISKAFGGLKAVDDLSFTIEPGQVTALIGPNGAGKTTAFNMLTGNLHPDSGQITYGGHNLTRMPPFAIARLGIGRSFQDVRVFTRMTVLENIVLATQGDEAERLSAIFSMSGRAGERQEQARLAALDLLEQFGLMPHANERAGSLSYAQQKQLVVATLVARRDPLILLDELAAGLDHESVASFSHLVRQIVKEGGQTVCLIEHNLDFVWQTADRVLVLDQGRLIAEGTPREIQQDQHVAEIYFGRARPAHA